MSAMIYKLVDYLVPTLHLLTTEHPDSPIILGADKNGMDLEPILNNGLRLKQIVDIGTRKNKILDVIITNIGHHYNSPQLVSPVPCDNPADGVPSDHCTEIAAPILSMYDEPSNEYRKKTTRPLHDSGIRAFGRWITKTSWDVIKEFDDPSTQANVLEEIIDEKLNEYLPTKTLKITQKDKMWITAELKKIDRLKKRDREFEESY